MADHRNEEASLLLGRNPVREAIERSPRNIEKVMIQQEGGGQDLADIRRLASDAGLQVQFVPEGRLNQLARGLNHQGAAAYAAPVAYVDVNEMLESIAPTREDVTKRKPRILV
ncbi:MAG: RNA methyltransferase substrate-binding domain-containing protein, partial [Rhodothermales bacterium]